MTRILSWAMSLPSLRPVFPRERRANREPVAPRHRPLPDRLIAVVGRVLGAPSERIAMPNINRPVRKHETNFRTRDGDTWEPFTDERHIDVMIGAFMVINKNVIWDK